MRLHRRAEGRRVAFTLIEMLLVMVIITTLAGLLLYAIGRAIKTTDEARAQNEIGQLSLALETFKATYGFYPPSRLKLCEKFGDYNQAQQLDQDSIYYLSRIASRITDSGGPWKNAGIDWDQNASIDTTGKGTILEGDECLVFFLAGIIDTAASTVNTATGTIDTPTFKGFSKNPYDPTDFASTTARTPSFYNFDSTRLRLLSTINPQTGVSYTVQNYPYSSIPREGFRHDAPNQNTRTGKSAYYSYLDTFGKNVYVYFSSYKGSNGYNRYYDPNGSPAVYPYSDCLQVGLNQQLAPYEHLPTSGSTVIPPGNGIWPYAASQGITLTSPPYGADMKGSGPGWVYQQPNTFQIICAGPDGRFGAGTNRTMTTPASQIFSPPPAPYPPGSPAPWWNWASIPFWTPAQAEEAIGPEYPAITSVPSNQLQILQYPGKDDLSNFHDRALGVSLTNQGTK